MKIKRSHFLIIIGFFIGILIAIVFKALNALRFW